MEIRIPRWLLLVPIALVLLVAGGFLLSRRLLPFGSSPDQAARSVAAQAVSTFFTADYADPDGWLKRFEPFSLPETVELLKLIYQPRIWPSLEKDRIVSSGKVVDLRKVGEKIDPTTQKPMQAWRYTVRVEPPWPGYPPEITGYVVVVRQDGDWKFAGFASEEEIQKEERP